jgi:hypothetical protein
MKTDQGTDVKIIPQKNFKIEQHVIKTKGDGRVGEGESCAQE